MDAQTLREVMGNVPGVNYEALAPGYNNAMKAANINNVQRAAMFAAQLGHESAGLRYMREIASGSDYEWRQDLGNVYAGDGERYAGRGPIQLTGRNGYRAFTQWARNTGQSTIDFEQEPQRLEEPHWGFLAASYYWTVARPKLNEYADAGDVLRASAAINGWYTNADGSIREPNGYQDRLNRYNRALAYGDRLLPGEPQPTMEKVLDYPRDEIVQQTFYFCGPASTQTIIYARTGVALNEWNLAAELGTTQDGTAWIGLFPNVLNKHLPGAEYRHVDMPNDPPTGEQREKLWNDIVSSINAGYGVVANIVAPPSNYPRAVWPDDISPNYRGGVVYHYIALMGYSDDGGRRIKVADSGFYPYGCWISFDQLATLIPPKGYAYSTAQPQEDDDDMAFGPDQVDALDQAKRNSRRTVEVLDLMARRVELIADQLLGYPKDENGNYLISGWNFPSILASAKDKLAKNKGVTLVEQVALLQERVDELEKGRK